MNYSNANLHMLGLSPKSTQHRVLLALISFEFCALTSCFALQDEFGYNAETQKLLCKNGETLLGAINFFVSSINTLVNKTMEDTLMTIKMYENAR